MANQKDDQKNEPTGRAEGQHGNVAHAQFIEQLHEGEHRESRADRAQHDRDRSALEGGRRLVEDREQHDEAEKNSEHTQHYVEHKLGRDQGPSDNTGNIHGVVGNRESRADNRARDSKGLRAKE